MSSTKEVKKPVVTEPSDSEKEPEDAVSPQPYVEPIEFIISTPGGSADDMFALYDIMRTVKEKCDIVTFGVGKVMSAGVLLLASGTKGKRKIGKNCRVMIHSIIGGTSGSFHNLENEMEEMKYIQNSYLATLCAESNMTQKQLKRMLNRKVNIYLSAEEAVKLGIADIIV
jgi:ATP-dependent Clp protease protease subunit